MHITDVIWLCTSCTLHLHFVLTQCIGSIVIGAHKLCFMLPLSHESLLLLKLYAYVFFCDNKLFSLSLSLSLSCRISLKSLFSFPKFPLRNGSVHTGVIEYRVDNHREIRTRGTPGAIDNKAIFVGATIKPYAYMRSADCAYMCRC